MNKPCAFNTFTLIGTNNIPAINASVELYEHNVTKAIHVHIASSNTENVFMVMFRTMPEDSTGVAHILEHTALCGSEKYPNRDPFFSMLRRSLNSFMNAFTSSDWTAYPFATNNKKDFDNLLGVYLDSAFFPRLAEVDFRQEGHRVEFKNPEDKNTELEFKGVVFNEMKGAMSPPERVLDQAVQTALCPNTTYAVNSGGEPADIPKLTYKQFIDFHKTHYHPSNAIFMTFGDIKACEHQQKFEENVLYKFNKAQKAFCVPNVKRFSAPKTKSIKYAFDEEDTSKRTFIEMAWLLGNTTNAYEAYKTSFLSEILLSDSSAPLMKALENTDLGTAPRCGVDDSNKEISFIAGLQGSEEKHVEEVEKLILDTLTEVAENGIEKSRIEALLDSMEADARDLEAGSYPLGLSMMFDLISSAVHGGDLLGALDVEPVLTKLRKEALEPNFVQNLVKDMLLNNNHRITMVAAPDTTLSKVKNDAEHEVLAKMKANMSEEEKDLVVQQAKELKQRQEAVDDVSCLPTVTMDDIQIDKTYPKAKTFTKNDIKSTVYSAGTNGLVAQKVVINLPDLTERQLQILPYYTSLLTEVAVGDRSFLQVGEWQTSICTNFSAGASFRSALGDINKVNAFVSLYVSGLERKSSQMIDMLIETINHVKFTEYDRIKDIVAQIKVGKENGVTASGHILAAQSASHGMSPCGDLSYKMSGLESVRFVKELDKSFSNKDNIAAFAKELAQIHELVKKSPRQVLVVAEDEKVSDIVTNLAEKSSTISIDNNIEKFSVSEIDETVNDMWIVNTQGNFCAKAYKAVPSTHADAPALEVLSVYIRDNFIHTAIREKGGAYGGGAGYNPDNATFAFRSYRDPRISGTLNDFDASIEWMKTAKHEEIKVHEAIFGVISAIDKPHTPISDAFSDFASNLQSRTKEVRNDYRSRILKVTADDLVRVVNTYLKPENASITVITSKEGLKTEGDIGLNVIQL